MAFDDEQYKAKISPFRKWIGFGIFFVLMGVAVALATGRLEKFRVTSGSMEPTIKKGDFLMVDARRPVVPKRGDIIAFYSPVKDGERLVKRIVAEPFDEVRFEDGLFYLNGKPQYDENYVTVEQIKGLPYQKPVKLDENEFYVLGDNRAYSFDSMNFGPVRPDEMIGIVKYIYWPRKRMQSLKNPYED